MKEKQATNEQKNFITSITALALIAKDILKNDPIFFEFKVGSKNKLFEVFGHRKSLSPKNKDYRWWIYYPQERKIKKLKVGN